MDDADVDSLLGLVTMLELVACDCDCEDAWEVGGGWLGALELALLLDSSDEELELGGGSGDADVGGGSDDAELGGGSEDVEVAELL